MVLPATFVAGSLAIAFSLPYYTDGFGGIPASAFVFIEQKAGSVIGFVIFLALFACTVTINGSRLLIACEILEHDRAFAKTMVGTSALVWHTERILRYAGFVCIESLILFAKFKAPVVYLSLLAVHVIVILWDLITLWAAHHSTASEHERLALRSATMQWLKIDALVAGVLAVVAGATRWSMLADQRVATSVLVLSVVLFAFVSVYAWVVDAAEHWKFYKRRVIEVAVHAALLTIVFVAVLSACGWHFKAVEHAGEPPSSHSPGDRTEVLNRH